MQVNPCAAEKRHINFLKQMKEFIEERASPRDALDWLSLLSRAAEVAEYIATRWVCVPNTAVARLLIREEAEEMETIIRTAYESAKKMVEADTRLAEMTLERLEGEEGRARRMEEVSYLL